MGGVVATDQPLIEVLFADEADMPRKPSRPTFASRLRKLRECRDLLPAQLAEAAGVTRGTYSNLEAGKREPSFHMLLAIARSLGVSLAEFDNCVAEPKAKPRKRKTPKPPPS